MNITRSIEPVWSCTDAARFLRLHPKTVKRLARLGQIPGRRVGRRWFFRPSDLDAMLCGSVDSSAKATNVAPQLSPESQEEKKIDAANSQHVSKRLD